MILLCQSSPLLTLVLSIHTLPFSVVAANSRASGEVSGAVRIACVVDHASGYSVSHVRTGIVSESLEAEVYIRISETFRDTHGLEISCSVRQSLA